MNKTTFKLQGREYIELMKLLKYEGLAESGADAKMLIDSGEVLVNGQPEFRRRNKIKPGDRVEIGGLKIDVLD
ncbi:MAG: RNA-binding S4 domain-containing protein [Bacteroidota bacterium]